MGNVEQGLMQSVLTSLAAKLDQDATKMSETPSDFIQKHFYVPDPRDPVTGERFPPGPIRLAEHQKRIIDEALARNEDGTLKYTTVVYSAPKKSGKSALASAVLLYAAYSTPSSYVACIANDGKQSADRLYKPIHTCFRLHHQLGGIFENVKYNLSDVILPNFTKIEAVTTDAAGEAGSQPLMVGYCYDDQTEILTKDGWKKYTEYSMDSEFLTLAPFGKLEYQKPTAVHVQEYSGKMYLLKTKRVDLCVTPNHKLYGKRGYKPLKDEPFKKFYVEEVAYKSKYGVRVESFGLDMELEVPEYITIPATKRKPELLIPIKLYLKLLGWYLAEGCTHKRDTIMIAQKEDSIYYSELIELIEELGYIPHKWKNTNALVFYDSRLAKHLKQFGLAHEKFIPAWVKKLPKEYFDIFYEAYWRGNGDKTGHATAVNGTKITSTNSKQLCDDLAEAAVLHGEYVTITKYQDKRWGRLIYEVQIKKWKNGERVIGSDKKYWKEIDYDGVIHCPTVPNGIVCIRRNGKVHWQGQSEIWGFNTAKKKAIWTEFSIPPTLYGYAMRWVESYAGYTGESEILEQLYRVGVEEGEPHPDFLDLQGKNGPVVTVNESARIFVYWDTEPRMVWQSSEYYATEAKLLVPSEFRRIHRNEWVSAASSFIEESWWDACHVPELMALPEGDTTPVVVGIDMAVSRDCAALVAVTRDPFDPNSKIAVRGVKIFSPKQSGGIIDQEMLVRPVMEEWFNKWNIICWVYDPKEMAKLAQDLTRAGFGWFKPFGQTTPRAISDKQLHDMIMHKQISWNSSSTEGDVGFKGQKGETLYNHITRAGAVTRGESYRLEKLSNSIHIDAAVALSQAAYTAMYLNISTSEQTVDSLIRKLQRKEISIDEFSERMRQRHKHLAERVSNE